MATVRVTVKGEAAKKKIQRVAAAMTPERTDPVVDRAAFMTQARLIRSTPKRWFGQVRRGWIVVKPRPGARVVINQNKVMLFLEEGTRDHGPREIFGPLLPGQKRRKAAMFVPLTRRAANATQGIYGVGTVDQFTVKGKTYWEETRAIFQRTETVRKGKKIVGSRALIFGQDYVLAKRVRGIKARRIVAKERPRSRTLLKRLMKEHIRAAIKGGR